MSEKRSGRRCSRCWSRDFPAAHGEDHDEAGCPHGGPRRSKWTCPEGRCSPWQAHAVADSHLIFSSCSAEEAEWESGWVGVWQPPKVKPTTVTQSISSWKGSSCSACEYSQSSGLVIDCATSYSTKQVRIMGGKRLKTRRDDIYKEFWGREAWGNVIPACRKPSFISFWCSRNSLLFLPGRLGNEVEAITMTFGEVSCPAAKQRLHWWKTAEAAGLSTRFFWSIHTVADYPWPCRVSSHQCVFMHNPHDWLFPRCHCEHAIGAHGVSLELNVWEVSTCSLSQVVSPSFCLFFLSCLEICSIHLCWCHLSDLCWLLTFLGC